MFGKIKNTASRTDMFLLEMTKEMIISCWDINLSFIDHVKWGYGKPFDPGKDRNVRGRTWILPLVPTATQAREATIEGVYFRERDFGKQTRATSHTFKVEFTLVRYGEYDRWSILSAFVYADDSGRRDFHFHCQLVSDQRLNEYQKQLCSL